MANKLIRRNELKAFIVETVIGEDLNKKFIQTLEKFIAKEYADEPEAGLCEYLNLGRWFDAEMTETGLTASTVIRELKSKLK